jgi:glycosyltransferase involved in cell wall biosynthesis
VSARADPNERLRLIAVGGGPLLDDLRRLAQSLGIASLVWLPGASQRIPEILRSLDIFVLPSLNEGISNTVLESMASGLPILATAVGGNPELIADGVCGRLFAPGDRAALSRLIADYADHAELRQSHGRAAREIALARFSLTAMVSGYESVYDRVCRRNDPGQRI